MRTIMDKFHRIGVMLPGVRSYMLSKEAGHIAVTDLESHNLPLEAACYQMKKE